MQSKLASYLCVALCVQFLALGLLAVCSCIIKIKRQLLILYHANCAYTVLWLSRGRKLLLIIFGSVTVAWSTHGLHKNELML